MRYTGLELFPVVVSGQSVVRFGLQKNVGDLPLPTGSNGPFSKRRPGFLSGKPGEARLGTTRDSGSSLVNQTQDGRSQVY